MAIYVTLNRVNRWLIQMVFSNQIDRVDVINNTSSVWLYFKSNYTGYKFKTYRAFSFTEALLMTSLDGIGIIYT